MIKIFMTVRNRLAITKKAIYALKKHSKLPYQLFVYDNATNYRIKEHFSYFLKLYQKGQIAQITFTTTDSTFNAFSKASTCNFFGQQHEEDPKKYTYDFILMIDNDIIANKGMIDKLVRTLDECKDENVAYAYASFEFKGYVNIKFIAKKFDVKRLLNNNYISSNSLIKTSIIEKIDFVYDNKYKRLLDWAYWLKLLKNGYIGISCSEAHFIAKSSANDVSAGSSKDFNLKRNRVVEDFILPMSN